VLACACGLSALTMAEPPSRDVNKPGCLLFQSIISSRLRPGRIGKWSACWVIALPFRGGYCQPTLGHRGRSASLQRAHHSHPWPGFHHIRFKAVYVACRRSDRSSSRPTTFAHLDCHHGSEAVEFWPPKASTRAVGSFSIPPSTMPFRPRPVVGDDHYRTARAVQSLPLQAL